MPREDSLSSRFDYLFEPLDTEESVHDVDPVGASAAGVSHDVNGSGGAPVRMAFAAFVLASLGAVAVVAVLLLQPTTPRNPDHVPVAPAPLPTPMVRVPSQDAAVSPPPDATADNQPTQTIETVPTQQVLPAQQQQTQTPVAPQRGMTNAPATRAPISVAPEPRAPFPNQGPRSGENGAGGLLGGLL